MSAVRLNRVSKFYGDFPALRAVTLDLEQGECLALLGRNGAGKTTLLKILAGLSRPQEGEVRIMGRDARHPATRATVGVLGHGIGLYDELSALENLLLFGRLYGVQDVSLRAREWLTLTSLDRLEHSLVREFSRGMRQRLAVARAFLHEPSLLLLDEPFTSLDDRSIEVLQQALRKARSRGATVIMITHQIREAMELASRVALLGRGKLLFHGPAPKEMLDDPGWLYRTYGEA
jgi:heme ABC exporter ATP-binding subunit CcmA